MKTRIVSSLIVASLLFLTHTALALPGGKPPKKVDIVTDEYGNPRISAPTNEKMFELLGYVVGQNELWGLEFVKRESRGTLAEILGPTYLSVDKARRLTGFTDEEFQSIFDSMSPEAQEIIESFVRGINQRISEVTENPGELLPHEFRMLGITPSRWYETDVIARVSALFRRFGTIGGRELTNLAVLQELMAKYDANTASGMFDDFYWANDPTAPTYIDEEMEIEDYHEPYTHNAMEAARYAKNFTNVEKASRDLEQLVQAGEKLNVPMIVDKASFAWAISKERTATGNPMLKGDPQAGYAYPNMREMHLRGGKGFNCAGMFEMGTPFIMFGRNEDVAWTFMVGMGDNVDIYAETLNPNNHEQYLFNGQWVNMEKRVETIKVAGDAPVTMTIYRTIHGPVVSPNPFDPTDPSVTQVYAWKHAHWLIDAKTMEANLVFMRANSVLDILGACKNVYTSMNIVSSDRNGNIAYCMGGRVPIRPSGSDFRLPLLGDGTMEWTGKYRQIPMALNPNKGFITGWNNKSSPTFNNPDDRYFGKFHRAVWPNRLLKDKTAMTFDDMKSVALTMGSLGYTGSTPTGVMIKDVLPYISEAINAVPATDPYFGSLNEALSILSTWDGRLMENAKTSTTLKVPYTIFNTWLPLMIKNVFQDEFAGITARNFSSYSDDAFNVILRSWDGPLSPLPVSRDYFDDISTPAVVESSDDMVVKSMKQTVDVLTTQFGTPMMSQWIVARPRTQIIDPPIGVIGDFPTQTAGTFSALYELKPKSIVGLSRWPYGSSSFIGTDSSGNPVYDNPHLFDMLNLYVNFEYQPIFIEDQKSK
jgi:penicillin amidase